MSTENKPQSTSWEQIKRDTLKLLESLGKAIDQTASELSKLSVVSLENEDRKSMDQLVSAGVVENRSQAVRFLIREGTNAKRELYAQIEKTNAEIQLLRQQLGTPFAGKQTE
jgi:Arc/MetJ-type ribon-helix-helix transcriptional regulator